MSGSLESVRWNTCEHRLDLGLYSHPKEVWGNRARTHVNSMGKIPSTGKTIFRGLNLTQGVKSAHQPSTNDEDWVQVQVLFRVCRVADP